MSKFCKYYVTGVLDTCDDIFGAMSAWIDPAVDRRICLVIYTGTVNSIRKGDHSFFQCSNSCDRFESRSRSLDSLGSVVVKRIGHIALQFCKVSCIYTSGHTVIIITWIRNQGTDFSCLNICYNTACCTGIKRQLGRCQLQIRDLIFDKIISVSTVSCCKSGTGLWIIP